MHMNREGRDSVPLINPANKRSRGGVLKTDGTGITVFDACYIPSTSMNFLGGISKSYDENFYSDKLVNIIPKEELKVIVKKANNTLLNYWPCVYCTIAGYACIPCTFGLSLCCPRLCISEAEKQTSRTLEQISLKSVYYDRKISFYFKNYWCSSSICVEFPINLNLNNT